MHDMDLTHPDILRAERMGTVGRAPDLRRQRIVDRLEEDRERLGRLEREWDEVAEVIGSARFLSFDLKDAVLEQYQEKAEGLREQIARDENICKGVG